MRPALQKATITRRLDVTHDLWIVWLKPDFGFKFKPGQYCTIGIDGIERPYSIVSSPHEEDVELLVELLPPPEGRLTPLLYAFHEGAEVTMRPSAKGIFTLDEKYLNHLMIATVTGVVPYLSILRSYLHNGRSGHVFCILHGASYADEFTYDTELQEMAQAHPDFITYIPTVSRPEEARNCAWIGETGRVHTLLEKYLAIHGLDPETTLIYACGHPGMIEEVQAQANGLGFTVKQERFWK